jgi:hypothetical protein
MAVDDDMALITHLLNDIDQIARIGFAKYRAYPPDILIEHDPRAGANCIYRHMVAEADRRWLDRRGIVVTDIRGLKVWLIEDKAVLRWKRMDAEGRARSYPTPQEKDFDLGLPLPGLPPPAIRLTAGYLTDKTQTQYERTQIARPRGKRIQWCVAVVPASAPGRATTWQDVTRQRGW